MHVTLALGYSATLTGFADGTAMLSAETEEAYTPEPDVPRGIGALTVRIDFPIYTESTPATFAFWTPEAIGTPDYVEFYYQGTAASASLGGLCCVTIRIQRRAGDNLCLASTA